MFGAPSALSSGQHGSGGAAQSFQHSPGVGSQPPGSGTGAQSPFGAGPGAGPGGFLNGNFAGNPANGNNQYQNTNNGAATMSQSAGGSDGGASGQPEYTLAGILHYLQTEWRRYERDRNEWEIERAEMRARIALLEGERRAADNVKSDLSKRVKMLEYALRQERSKYLSITLTGVPATKHAQLQDKGSTGSGHSSPRSEDLGLPETSGPTISGPIDPQNSLSGMSRLSSMNNSLTNGATQLSRNPTSIGRDPKSRTKSREYLKQCLQEISYLTSTSTLNPLAERPTVNSTFIGSSLNLPPRPRQTLPENVPPAMPSHSFSDNPVSTSAPAFTASPAGSTLRRPVPSKEPTLTPASTNTFGKAARSNTLTSGRSPLIATETVLEEAPEGSDGASSVASSDEDRGRPNGVELPSAAMTDPQSASLGQLAALQQEPVAPSSPRPNGAVLTHDDAPMPSLASVAAATAVSSASAGEDASDKAEEVTDLAESEDGSLVSSGSESSGDRDSGSWSSSTSARSSEDSTSEEGEQLTAIFRGSKDEAAWKALRGLGEKGRERRLEREKRDREELGYTPDRRFLKDANGNRIQPDDDELANLALQLDEEGLSTGSSEKFQVETGTSDHKMWKAKRSLRSHLDSVRAVAFSQTDYCLVSAGDDNTIKVWRLDAAGVNSGSTLNGAMPDTDPIVTYRGHSAGVTCLAVSSSDRRIYSGSLDATVRVWTLPDRNTETYPPFDRKAEHAVLVGHTQPIYDMALLPLKVDEEVLLATASADGTVKVWSTNGLGRRSSSSSAGASSAGAGSLKLSWDYWGTEPDEEKMSTEKEEMEKANRKVPVPISVTACHSDLKRCAVAYDNSVVKLFEVQTGRDVLKMASDETYDGTPATMINKVITHPTMPLLVTAHEDKYIRLFDLETGACTHSMLAHLDAVTSLDIDPSGLTLVSGGHDCSVRFWDISSSRACVQEITAHRKKAEEGVLDVKYHPAGSLFASAGADGIVRLYG